MAKGNKGLGMGLDALLKMNVQDDEINERKGIGQGDKVIAGFVELPINKIIPNQSQPRKNFNKESISELAQSIKNYGLIQPITVIKKDSIYEIVAGERRYRASKEAGLEKVPVIIKDISQKEKLAVSLVENIQRENLNPIEEALAFSSLIESYNITQEELAQKLGKSRTAITNSIRLLNLDIQIRSWIMEGKLTPGHARSILSVTDVKEHLSFANYILSHELSVRETEILSKKWPLHKAKNKKGIYTNKSLEIKDAEQKLQQKLKTKVIINGKVNKGKILIDYFSEDELERVINLIIA